MDGVQQELDKRGVLTLRLNRPDVHNAFDDRLIASLTTVLLEAGQNPAVRLVVLTGAPPSFSAGADLGWMRRMAAADEEENERDALALAALMRALNYLECPTIARVNGHAFGGGVGLIACCDIAIAVDTARFGVTEARLGLAPAVISPYVIRRIGEYGARRYFLSGERFDASRAQALGLVHEVVSEQALDEAVERSVSAVLESGATATRACKALIFDVCDHGPERQRKIDQTTARLIARLRVSTEGQEGLTAFLEKRKPDWCAPSSDT